MVLFCFLCVEGSCDFIDVEEVLLGLLCAQGCTRRFCFVKSLGGAWCLVFCAQMRAAIVMSKVVEVLSFLCVGGNCDFTDVKVMLSCEKQLSWQNRLEMSTEPVYVHC